MPTYEYHCDACQHHFDEFQSITEKPLRKCPQCRKLKLRRIYGTGVAVLFKGSGFYQTDYRSESYKAAAKADQESAKPPTDANSGDKTGTTGTTDSNTKETKPVSKPKGKTPKSGT